MIKLDNNGHNGHSRQDLLTGRPEDIVTLLAPRSEWDEKTAGVHCAQFYDTDAFLLNSLSNFVRLGLSAGDAVVIVATKSHREELEKLLTAEGVDVFEAIALGSYVSLDAADTLAQFLADGIPDERRFAKTIGDLITKAAQGGRPVRVFGEMVALLWSEEKCEEAIRLEEMWNTLGKTHPFVLYCAYPLNVFGSETLSAPLLRVCAEHTGVIPAESYTALETQDQRLRAVLQLQQKARSLEAEVAERKKAEEELRASLIREQIARTESETANRMKDEFLATVSHELRTPLNAIMGWSHMLRTGKLDPPVVERALETIHRNAKAQAQLVEDILDVSRMITGKLRLDMETVDVASVINAAIDAVQLAAESKGIQLKVTLDPSARHTFGDSSRLQQVVWNLLSNAIKFTPPDGHVELRLERVDASIQLRVSDSGQGIKSEFLPFVFDRFRQADATSTRQLGGLGLGLAIVRHLVELHGGTVEAASDGEGCGATFTITLPLAGERDRAKYRRSGTGTLRLIEEAEPIVPSLSLTNVQVLLVDDDQDTLHLLTVSLSESNARVQTASSVAEALEMLEWFEPDVLVSDLAMPGEDGYSLIRKVREIEAENGKHTPAVALTSYVRIEDRTRALSAGFNMFVPKPIQANELLIAIASLAESRSL
ncbi:MAG: ATP-binding protein [Acidobacteriota bacterium]|nr:ATP-binding protein [Acidobacteriota bacterium]